MSSVSVNGAAMLTGTLTLVRYGAWVATFTLDSTEDIGTDIEIQTFDKRLSLKGTIARGEVKFDKYQGMAVAGKGGLQKDIPARSYNRMPAKTIAEDICSEAGEKLSPTSAIDTELEFWAREETTADRALTVLVAKLGLTWRVLPDGTIWIGKDLYPPANPEGVTLEHDGGDGVIVLGVEAFGLLPGTKLDGRQVEMVIHSISSAGVQTRAFFGGEDRIRSAFSRIIRKALPGLDYYAAYAHRVVKQNDDETLELEPFDARRPPLSKVPIRYGVPGIACKVRKGARVYVEFESANPAVPVATVWDALSVEEITVKAEKVFVKATSVDVNASGDVVIKGGAIKLGPGAQPVARQGDAVVVVSPVPGMSIIPGMPLAGVIVSGNPKVTA